MAVAPLLVSADTLARQLDGVAGGQAAARDPRCVVVDCRADLMRPAAGLEAWRAGHIPGSVHADLDTALAGPKTPSSGRHPLPDRERFAHQLAEWGITPLTHVVACDEGSGAFAARLWWLLRWMGHRAVSLLDGGYRAWTAAGLPVSRESPPPTPVARPRLPGVPEMPTVSAGEIARLVPAGQLLLIDVRSAERFRGDVEPIDPVAGHVPGAVNLPYTSALTADGRFRSSEELRQLCAPVLAGRPASTVAVMCGSGVTACHGIFSLELAGFPGARLYPGSWSEWIREPERPVAVG